MYCCTRGTFHCQYTNEVQFKKLKKKYNIDEDIMLDYMLQDKFRSSTRDWIGIFPRGWTNLLQYLTFEYVIVAPKLSLSIHRRIVFLHTFHREASPNIDYQFVYVSKEIKILGTSSYFRFVVSPSLRSLDRSPDTPEIVDDACPPSTLSSKVAKSGKILTKSRSIDNIIESQFLDQRRRTCRVCHNSRSIILDSSYTANKAQFLSLLNEQLMARVGRLDRDLELTEAALKKEKMARMELTRKLHAYETFVAEMFRCLNVMGIVRIRNYARKEITIQKVKTKDLSLMRDRSVPIPEVSMLNRPVEYKSCNEEETAVTNETEDIPQDLDSSLEEAIRIDELGIHNSEIDKELTVKKEFTSTIENFDANSLAEEENLITASKIEEDFENESGCCVTKEAANAIKQQEDNKVDCKIEQDNHVEGKAKRTENNVDVDKKCCCDCHSNAAKGFGDSPKSDENNLREWILEGECFLKMSNGMHIEKNLESCFTDLGAHNASSMESNTENDSSQKTPQSQMSAVVIRCRNAKLSVIK